MEVAELRIWELRAISNLVSVKLQDELGNEATWDVVNSAFHMVRTLFVEYTASIFSLSSTYDIGRYAQSLLLLQVHK